MTSPSTRGPEWRGTRRLDTRVFFKPTGLGICLGHDSGHPESVHQSWPCGRFNSFASKCTSQESLINAQQRFISDLMRASSRHPALNKLRSSIGRPRVLKSKSDAADTWRPRSWLVIQFSKVWTDAKLGGIAKRIFEKWHSKLSEVVPEASAFSLGCCWRLAGPHFGRTLKLLNYGLKW